MFRDGKPEGFFYLDYQTFDGKYNFIADVYVTPENVHDSVPYLERLDRQITRFGFQVEEVALDAGYLTMPICQELKEQEIFSVIAHRRFRPKKGLFHKWQFKYIPEKDVYVCPAYEGACQSQGAMPPDWWLKTSKKWPCSSQREEKALCYGFYSILNFL
jgi:hypothetical protein